MGACDGVRLDVRERDDDCEGVRDGLCEREGVAAPLLVLEPVTLGVLSPLGEGVAAPLALCERVSVGVTVADALIVAVDVPERVSVSDGDSEAVSVGDTLGVAVSLGEPVWLGDCVVD